MYMNMVFVGNLGDEPSMRYTPGGHAGHELLGGCQSPME